MKSDDSFEATYAVKMHCNGCTNDIKSCLQEIPGIEGMQFDLGQQIMSVNGTVAPSSIISALRRCGRDAIIRGTGKPNSSAVSILESHEGKDPLTVRGLVRMVQVAEKRTLFDVTINGVEKPGNYYASVREQGDVSKGATSTGSAWHQFEDPIECNQKGERGLFSGQGLLKAPVNVWEMIGRGFVITGEPSHEPKSTDMCGVIARSAGTWENAKQVCACSGKTVWQEREDALHKNIERSM